METLVPRGVETSGHGFCASRAGSSARRVRLIPAEPARERLFDMIKRLFCALLLVSTASCGFHLRGQGGGADTGAARLGKLYVNATPTLTDDVGALVGAETLVARRDKADTWLDLSSERFNRRVLSVDPKTGKEREFELTYTLNFSARRGDGKTLLGGESVRLTRDFIFDRDAVVGSSREQAVLRGEMRRNAVRQVLRRVAAARAK